MNPPVSVAQRRYLKLLLFLLVLFCGRVLGQLSVALFHVPFLPPMEEWFSGFLNYPLLVLCQLLIILLYGKVCFDLYRGKGFFAVPNRRMGSWLLTIGILYLATMLIRYGLRMSLYPHERWTGGSIPIAFHCVLASFLIGLGKFHYSHCALGEFAKRNRISSTSIFAILASIGIGLWSLNQLTTWVLAKTFNMRPAQFAVRVESDRSFVTKDGVRLVADIFHPQHLKKSPTILVRIPLSSTWQNNLICSLAGRLWAERGYTVVIQGTRGRLKSGGTMYPLIYERSDGVETLQWISRQPWFNGKIGSWGGSSFGYTQWCISDERNPNLNAMMIYESSTDFYSMFYPGNAFSLASALNWAGKSHGKEDRAAWFEPAAIAQAASGFPSLDADKRLTGTKINFYRDWVTHSSRDEYWRGIDGVNRGERSLSPALLMAGWYDPFLPGQLLDFNRLRNSEDHSISAGTHLIIGPWRHASAVTYPDATTGDNFRVQTFTESIPFFDKQLNPPGAIDQSQPLIKIFVQGKNYWRTEQEWPLLRTCFTPLYLRSEGNANGETSTGFLSSDPPAKSEHVEHFTSNANDPVPTAGGAMLGIGDAIALQNSVEKRNDVLNFTGPRLANDQEVTGPVTAFLDVESTAKRTDFTAKLVDVFPNGKAYNVCDGIQRIDLSDADKTREVRVDLWPTSYVFLKDHRIRVEISSSNFPRYDCNLESALQTLRHDKSHPSRLILPIIPAPTRDVFALGANL